ncbi:MAG: hypothetical protein PHC62_07895 [Candidatus Izemoplasmatales bacterium]|jgi:hypothetical protein|nr:hypothetical protein [Candidatus Izemoplasmatales bacterium]
MRDIPKFTKMIINDYFVLITFLGGVASLGLSLGTYVAGDFLTEGIYIVCGALFFFILCLWKIIYIRNIFSVGIEQKAEVTKVYFYRSRGTIMVHYSMNGATFSSSTVVVRNRLSTKIEKGMSIIILVHPQKEKRFVIPHIYQ